MNNKKKMVLGAAFVVAIMALAGIGYAITDNFNGETSAVAKVDDADYVTISLSAENYSTTTLPITKAFYWDTETAANGTITYTPRSTQGVDYTYDVTIGKNAVEGTDKLELTIVGFATITGYTVSCTWNGTDAEIVGDTVTVASADASTWNVDNEFIVTIAPASAQGTTDVPATTVTFPALTFTLTGQNVAAPA